jgi:DNA-binding transcriptional LysR family regulator
VAASDPFRIGFAAGVTPDKWARTWAERRPRDPLELVPLDDRDGVVMLHQGELSMCFLRLPVDREGLHLIPLYDEQPVVVASREHPVAAYDTIAVAELADETFLEGPARATIGSAAAGAGLVLVPMSVARLHHRRDVVHVPVTGVETTTVGLGWRVDDEDDRVREFIGVVRGRTANSSRR